MQEQCTFVGCNSPVWCAGLCRGHYQQKHTGRPLKAILPRQKRGAAPEECVREFWSRVSKSSDENGCWEWTRGTQGTGYGWFRFCGTPTTAHALSWKLHNMGRFPTGLCVCHTCDNRLCVRPSHLFLGTDLDNSNDKIAKGRLRTGVSLGEKHGCAKLTAAQVIEMRRLHATGGYTFRSLGQRFNVTDVLAHKIVRRQLWASIPEPVPSAN